MTIEEINALSDADVKRLAEANDIKLVWRNGKPKSISQLRYALRTIVSNKSLREGPIGGLLDFVPVVGDVKGVVETLDAFSKGQLIAGGILAAGTAAGLVPIVGDFASKAAKVYARKLGKQVSPQQAATMVAKDMRAGKLDPQIESLARDLQHQFKRHQEVTKSTPDFDVTPGTGYSQSRGEGLGIIEEKIGIHDKIEEPADAYVLAHELGHANAPRGKGARPGTSGSEWNDQGIITKAYPGTLESEVAAWQSAAEQLMRHNPTQAQIDGFLNTVKRGLFPYLKNTDFSKGTPKMAGVQQEITENTIEVINNLQNLTIDNLIRRKDDLPYQGLLRLKE